MKFILNSKKVLFAVLAAVLFSACLISLPTEAEATIYSVTYYANGGSGSVITDKYVIASIYAIRQNTMFSRAGYTFDGWNTRADGKGVNYAPGYKITFGSFTLYAKWKAVPKITASYCPNGGTGANIIDSVTPNSNHTIRQNSFTRTGYIFSGWNTKANGTGISYFPGQVIRLTSSITLYAQWKIAGYTVTFYPNGGTGPIITKTVLPNDFSFWPPSPTRPGYIFDGWYTNAAGTGTKYIPGQRIILISNLALYAKWIKIPTGTITYYPNGGIGAVITDIVNLGTSYNTIRSNPFTRAGYTFAGWSTNAAGTGAKYMPGQVVAIPANLSLYAMWTKIIRTVTITYNLGNGSTIVDTVNVGEMYFIRPCPITKPGYIFDGWWNGNTRYYPGQAICPTMNMIFYIRWRGI